MKISKPIHLLLALPLLATTMLWGGLTVKAAQAGPDVRVSSSANIAVTIDPVQAFSFSERAIYLTGQVDCPAGASVVIDASVWQRGSSDPIVTGFSSTSASAAGTTLATEPSNGRPSSAQGTSGTLPCGGAGTAWQVTAHFLGNSSFSFGPAEVCVIARVERGVRGHLSANVCQTVELIGG